MIRYIYEKFLIRGGVWIFRDISVLCSQKMKCNVHRKKLFRSLTGAENAG